jgi:hypothetical protein
MLATEMDCLQKRMRFDRTQNKTIKQMMEMEKDIIDEVQKQ